MVGIRYGQLWRTPSGGLIAFIVRPPIARAPSGGEIVNTSGTQPLLGSVTSDGRPGSGHRPSIRNCAQFQRWR